ncbi:MAG: DNA-3-methyladenine glycosylase I [Parvibaculaceae bacterium]
MPSFAKIRARAAKRKGGEAVLASLLPKPPSQAALKRLSDDRVLAEMSKRIFSSGFVWSVIENKWPGFEEAFLGFEPKRLLFQPEEFWDGLLSDKRIVRHPQKIRSVRENAQFVSDIAAEHGSFGKFLSDWPLADQVGLLDLLGKRGSRLGGATGQYFLRFLGRDGFMTSRDMIQALKDAGLDISEKASSKRDLQQIQEQFNAWQKETGLPYMHLSRICAMSIGENHDAESLKRYMSGDD